MAHGPSLEEYKVIMDMKIYVSCSFTCPSNSLGHPVAFVTSHMNGLKPFERTIERTTETITPSSKSITAAAMTTNRITSLREPLNYRYLPNPTLRWS